MLTTITPYWNRPEVFNAWIKALAAAAHPCVHHLVFFIGEQLPAVLPPVPNIRLIGCQVKPGKPRMSIGHYHNMGAELANTEWIMKLDVDAIPNTEYFLRLLPQLAQAREREWFNGGMFYANKQASARFLSQTLTPKLYASCVRDVTSYEAVAYRRPAASNFICRKKVYLALGGCDERFRGWGWEDYQQLYMLERFQQQQDPIPGEITLETVTKRCRDEISRPKAKALFERDNMLALIHHWHQENKEASYKSPDMSRSNRAALLDYIQKARSV